MQPVIYVICFVIATNLSRVGSKQLPSFVQRCSRSDRVALSNCLVQRTEDLKPRLLKGIPELKFPPIEPLHVPKLELDTGTGASASFGLNVTNANVTGLKDYVVSQFDFDFDEKKINVHVQIPKLFITGDYSVRGKILLFEVAATGVVESTVTEVDALTHLNFKLVTKNGKDYIIVTDDYKLDYKIAKVILHLTDLFKGNSQLTEEVNKAINDDMDTVFNEIKPFLFDSMYLILKEIVKPLLHDYSVDELFE